jgi:hypothetical protein
MFENTGFSFSDGDGVSGGRWVVWDNDEWLPCSKDDATAIAVASCDGLVPVRWKCGEGELYWLLTPAELIARGLAAEPWVKF